ncbi:hypothetical protein AAG570_002256 [Ranatra chinensis]|uniref:Brix domain-containing protein n=1 Tax=Ranatra chinensis TaxID=642074 RepID=A0ABD0Y917_9HEMI
MGRKKKGRSVKRNPQATALEPDELTRAPHSFVIHRGSVGKYVRQLTLDFRKIMEPFTASSLIVRKKNTLKDFASVSGLLNVSHLVMFTCTELGPYMRVARLPQGPTLTFKIHDYCLARDVISSLKRQMPHSRYYSDPPLVVLNGFSVTSSQNTSHMKLMATMFQGMFPTINVTKINLNNVRRCLLFNYDAETKKIDVRHFGIRVSPVGLSKGMKKLVKGKVPNLAKYDDVADFLIKDEQLSESEAEDDPNSHVTLPQKISSRGNLVANKSAVRLTQIGPRLTIQLIKVEGGLLDGEVMYHEYIVKTPEEIALIEKRRLEKRKLKEKRKRQQEKNVKEKQQKKEELKRKSLEGMRMKNQNDSVDAKPLKEAQDDDDAEWYRKEVGKDPEPGIN